MKKIVLKTFSAVVSFIMLAEGFASAAPIKIGYSSENYKIKIEGDGEAGFANISVMSKAAFNDIAENEERLNDENLILLSVPLKSGKLEKEIILDESFIKGLYIISVDCGDKSYKRYFVKNDANAVNSVFQQFITTSDPAKLLSDNMGSLFFDASLFNSCKTDITKQLKAFYNIYSVNSANFSDMYLLSEGISAMKNQALSADEFVEKYVGIVSAETVESYASLNKDIKEELLRILPFQSFEKESVENVFKTALMLSDLNVSGEKAWESFISYLEGKGEDFTSYNKLNTYYKELLAGSVTGIDYTDISTVTEAFRNGVKEKLDMQLKEEKSESKKPSGGGGGGGGGGFAISEKPSEKPSEAEKFNDISSHWAKDAIVHMAEKGIVNGYSDGSFKPDGCVTRAEFVKMLCEVMLIGTGKGTTFSDVPENAWYAPYVYAAFSEGLVNGVKEDSFMPENKITREDSAVILYRALTKKGVNLNSEAEFNDGYEISDYAKEAVRKLCAGGIIKGSEGNFRPKNTLTRAETVTMLERIIEFVR